METEILSPGIVPGAGTGPAVVLPGLEHKFARFDSIAKVENGVQISGYASLFGTADQGGDVVQPGAYAASVGRAGGTDHRIRMLWQHDPSQPIGIWDELREDGKGLWVRGRILDSVARGREAAALIEAGAIDGLSIGYRILRSTRDRKGQRLLHELDLWEVSVVTFPMLPQARVGAKSGTGAQDHVLRETARVLRQARAELAAGRPAAGTSARKGISG